MLDDGTYDALIVDATDDGDVTVVEVAVLGGVHKGEVVAVRATKLGRDSLDLLGLPATLVVVDGAPTLTVDD